MQEAPSADQESLQDDGEEELSEAARLLDQFPFFHGRPPLILYAL